ncbi:hypothetical protein [Pedobacter jamesrossensis]|uniref:Uncharacterized protein n=1 Tax=Pedobacter jamesrossensis TaxID=1908238 RepID=A0ABV8NNY3_9SPHI
MYDAFFELLDQLHWKGYAENLQEENPQIFNIQFNEFLTTYKN